jgi:putative ABC transport system permease protein
MLKTNLKLAFRSIFHNKLYATINIVGLSIASAFCILVYMYVGNEKSFDNFHRDGGNLLRVEETELFSSNDAKPKKSLISFLINQDDQQKNMIVTPLMMAEELKSNFPEVQNAVRIKNMYNPIIRVGDQSYKEKDENCAYADADFFQVFNFPLVEGNPASVLADNKSVIISESLAKKYFGNSDPVGKTLNITSDKLLLTVTGVAKDFPQNSSFRFDIVVPRKGDLDYKDEGSNGVNSFSEILIIRLMKGTNLATFQHKLDAFAKTYFKPLTDEQAKYDPKVKAPPFKVYLRPFAQAHFNQSSGWSHYTDMGNIYQLVFLTVIILLIACANYILLTLTSTISRSQNVGVRKTVGASRRQIIAQYYTETQLLAFISVIVGFMIAVICLPFFNSLTGSEMKFSDMPVGTISLLLFSLAIIMGIVAGIYPALTMSGLKPLNIMKSFSAFRLNPSLSRVLVTVQFSICIMLIISALVINRQMHYISTANMGFATDQVVLVQNPYGWDDEKDSYSLKERIQNFVATQPYLDGMTTANYDFAGYNTNGHIVNGKRVMIQELNVDYNFLQFNKVPIINGRNFSPDIASDTARVTLTADQKIAKNSTVRTNIIVNETLYKLLDKPKLDVFNREMGGTIIGVSKDYHTDDLTKPIEPSYHKVATHYVGYFWIKIRAGQSIPQAMDKLHAFWDKETNSQPFSFTFMDQKVAKSYESFTRWMLTVTTACILAIIIACLGLFGLSGITTLNRTKEIGIRKVLGASVSNLFILLNRGTIIMAAVSFIIAAPLAFYLVNGWLQNFAYRITPDWVLFVVAAILAIATAIISVSYHTLRAATANPVNSLRNE